MWRIEEHRRIDRQVESAPIEIRKRYEKWLDIATISGPPGLQAIRGFRDEALAGEWAGHRSSRITLQYRVIYRVVAEKQLIQVEALTAHDYRRRR